MPLRGGEKVVRFSMWEANGLQKKLRGNILGGGRIRTFRRRSTILWEKRHREVVKSKEITFTLITLLDKSSVDEIGICKTMKI